LSIGESGCGKDSARQALRECFTHAGLGDMASVRDLASDSAIITALDSNPSQIFLLDEIGHFLTATQSSKNTHLYKIVPTLLELYSSASQTFSGKTYADKDKQMIIDCPNLCLYGTTVPDTLYKGLTVQNIKEGFLSRMLIFESEDIDPELDDQKDTTRPPSSDLIHKMKTLYDRPINHSGTGSLAGNLCSPEVVNYSKEASHLFSDFGKNVREIRAQLREENRYDNIYNRAPLIAQQIALILSVSNNPTEPMIREEEAIYAIKLVKYLTDNMLYVIENYIASNDHEHELKRILSVIRRSGKISLSELTRKTQNLQSYARKDIIETLIQSDQIEEVWVQGKTKKIKHYIAT